MNVDKIGKLIKKIRKDNHLTQKELAEKYNITYQAVSKWENGKNIPDISLLKQICNDFKIDLNAFLDGNYITNETLNFENKKIKYNNLKYIKIAKFVIILFIVIFLIGGIKYLKNNDSFEFKTISSNCDNFTITGSIAYNDIKSAIYIANINYCGGSDNNLYKSIDCILYEKNNDLENKISQVVIRNEKAAKLEKLLQSVSFNIDNYMHKCKEFQKHELFVEIKATDEKQDTTIYKVPLIMNNACNEK